MGDWAKVSAKEWQTAEREAVVHSSHSFNILSVLLFLL